MAQATWEALFAPRQDWVRKALFGSVLVQDYNPSNTSVLSSTYSPFDAASGQLSTTLLTTDGFVDVGYLDDTGVSFTPNFTIAKTAAWQTRRDLRQDVTEADETAKFTCLQTSPVTEALYNNVALATLQPVGTPGWSLVSAANLSLVWRSLLFIGVDGSGTSEQYTAKFYPKALMIKPEKQDWAAKGEVSYGVSFVPFPDPVSGITIKEWHDGPGWRSMVQGPNPITALTSPTKTTTSVSLSWTASAVDSTHGAPTSYLVHTTTGTGTPVGTDQVITAPTTTATVSGLTTGTAYIFSVTAQNSAGNSTPVTINVTTS